MVGPSSTGAGRGLFVALNPGVDRTVLPKGTPIGGYSKRGTWEQESSGDKCVAYAFSGLEVGVFFEKELVSLLEAVRVFPLKTWGVKTVSGRHGFQNEAGPSDVPEHTFWMVMRPLRHHFWFLFL
jgi:hypothetical protein